MSIDTKTASSTDQHPVPNLSRQAFISFGLFAIFFIFYMATAIIQTPGFKETAAIQFMGAPLGFVLSIAVFPVASAILVFYFWIWR